MIALWMEIPTSGSLMTPPARHYRESSGPILDSQARAARTILASFCSATSAIASGVSAKVAKPQSGLRSTRFGPKRRMAASAFAVISSTDSTSIRFWLTTPNSDSGLEAAQALPPSPARGAAGSSFIRQRKAITNSPHAVFCIPTPAATKGTSVVAVIGEHAQRKRSPTVLSIPPRRPLSWFAERHGTHLLWQHIQLSTI